MIFGTNDDIEEIGDFVAADEMQKPFALAIQGSQQRGDTNQAAIWFAADQYVQLHILPFAATQMVPPGALEFVSQEGNADMTGVQQGIPIIGQRSPALNLANGFDLHFVCGDVLKL